MEEEEEEVVVVVDFLEGDFGVGGGGVGWSASVGLAGDMAAGCVDFEVEFAVTNG